jgi:hypothetical protein
MAGRDNDRRSGDAEHAASPDERTQPSPAGGPAAAKAGLPTRDPVCTSYG